MNTNDLRQKSVEELREELMALKREQFNLRMQGATNQDAKPHLMRAARRNVARIKTIIAEKERG